MLEKPDLTDEKIAICLKDSYGLQSGQIQFLPLGADRNTAVYRVIDEIGKPYFVKLRSGDFDETSVALTKFLSEQDITQIIAPLRTRSGGLAAELGDFRVMLYPFVMGRDGYEVDLSDRQWLELGAALKHIHTIRLPAAFRDRIREETYSPFWRERLEYFLGQIETGVFHDSLAIKLAAFLKSKREIVEGLILRAGRLAGVLQSQQQEFVLCHADIHAGNVLIDAQDRLYIVDWDEPVLAPKERDLMFAGGGLFGGWRTPQEEETLFYRGYGPTQIDPIALAYYRYERIIQDLAVECEQIFLIKGGEEDREREYDFFVSNFLPGNTIEIAYESDRKLRKR